MNIPNVITNGSFAEKVNVKLIMETEFTKEISIHFKPGQLMKKHKTPFPIVVHLLEGRIEFGIEETKHLLSSGDMLTLNGNIPHDLLALDQSIVRLTLMKSDKLSRVKTVSNN